jgi:hypothetical protein
MTLKPYALLALVVLVVAVAGAVGYALGVDDAEDDRPTANTADCPIVQVPVSDHVEALCLPEAAPLFDVFDELSTPPRATAEGWSLIGELWLSQDNEHMGTRARVCAG